MIIKTVGIQYISQTWPLIEKYIVDSQQYGGGDYSSEHVKVYLATGQWMLVVAVDENNVIHGAMTLSFVNYPNDRIAFVTTTGGKGIISKDSLKQLKDIVKQYGATKVQAAVRPSMERLLNRADFYTKYKIVESKI